MFAIINSGLFATITPINPKIVPLTSANYSFNTDSI